MTDDEYREFLSVLSRRYVHSKQLGLGRAFHHKMMDEWTYHLNQAERAARLAKFIESDCREEGDLYNNITLDRLEKGVNDTQSSVNFHNWMLEDSGYLEALDAHAAEIFAGLRPEHIPAEDKDVLRRIGCFDADAELAELVYRAKARGRRMQDHGDPNFSALNQDLRRVAERLEKAASEFERLRGSDKGKISIDEPPKRKSRRWFTGIGRIAQGAALSIANMAAAAGALPFPVSPEIQTWGAIASVATGVGTILNGVGDLLGE